VAEARQHPQPQRSLVGSKGGRLVELVCVLDHWLGELDDGAIRETLEGTRARLEYFAVRDFGEDWAVVQVVHVLDRDGHADCLAECETSGGEFSEGPPDAELCPACVDALELVLEQRWMENRPPRRATWWR
jgi:hypothetical protein